MWAKMKTSFTVDTAIHPLTHTFLSAKKRIALFGAHACNMYVILVKWRKDCHFMWTFFWQGIVCLCVRFTVILCHLKPKRSGERAEKKNVFFISTQATWLRYSGKGYLKLWTDNDIFMNYLILTFLFTILIQQKIVIEAEPVFGSHIIILSVHWKEMKK